MGWRVDGGLTPQAQRRRWGAAPKRATGTAVRCSDWLGNGATLGANRAGGQDKKRAGHRKAGAAANLREEDSATKFWRSSHPQPGE